MNLHRFLPALAVALLLIATIARAETRTAILPAEFADFAMHPETGAVAALSAETNEVALFRYADLKAVESAPAAKIKVGGTPCSVVYKRFGDKRVFAVVCSQDSHMYVIDAGATATAPFAQLAKIELAQSGVSYVTASINPEDPFLYYCYGGGHDSLTGAVSLRDMTNQGVAFADSMDCAISASGTVAYRRGPWSPSGFESLMLSGSLADKKPTFSRLFYAHNSTAQYVPDPFNRFTAAGVAIHTVGLEKKEATLDFTPLCFFQTKPILVGVSGGDLGTQEKGPILLRAASYNTFTNVGEQVRISPSYPGGDGNLPRGTGGSGDFKRVAKRARMVADDVREQVVYFSANSVTFVPLADFEIPKEPFLFAQLDKTELVAGKANTLTLKVADPQVKLSTGDLPEGMRTNGGELSWTPDLSQIGPATIVITLEHGNIQRTQHFELTVRFPCLRLPFAAQGLVVDADSKTAVVWDAAPPRDQFGRPTGADSQTTNLAVVDLATGAVTAQRRISAAVHEAVVTDKYFVFCSPPGGGGPTCEVLKLGDLSREKSLVAAGDIQVLRCAGGNLFLQSVGEVEVFKGDTFKRLGSFPFRSEQGGYPHPERVGVLPAGIYSQGTLFGFDLQPQLIVAPQLPGTSNTTARVTPPPFLSNTSDPQRPLQRQPHFDGQSQLAEGVIPGTKRFVTVESKRQIIQVPGTVHTNRVKTELVASVAGTTSRQVLSIRTSGEETANKPAAPPAICIVNNEALILDGAGLFRWPLPKPSADDATPTLSFVPQQSALVLAGETTQLKHETVGGKAPLTFSLPPGSPMQIDEKTGTILLDNKQTLAEARRVLKGHVQMPGHNETLVEALRSKAQTWIEHATFILRRKPAGIPVAVPIRVTVADSDFASVTTQYYVIAELPSTEIVTELQQLDAERAATLAKAEEARAKAEEARPAAKPAIPAAGDPLTAPAEGGTEVAELKRRIMSLEQRLDVMTRLLNTAAEKLEKLEKK